MHTHLWNLRGCRRGDRIRLLQDRWTEGQSAAVAARGTAAGARWKTLCSLGTRDGPSSTSPTTTSTLIGSCTHVAFNNGWAVAWDGQVCKLHIRRRKTKVENVLRIDAYSARTCAQIRAHSGRRSTCTHGKVCGAVGVAGMSHVSPFRSRHHDQRTSIVRRVVAPALLTARTTGGALGGGHPSSWQVRRGREAPSGADLRGVVTSVMGRVGQGRRSLR
jgi:hypothetical protein